ncbi:hypothetical protein [Magnetofaba australis]|uniref:hypothetical protein n=1 Tax=Magnetofaba australis TaxID=1472297 RepID=UPI001301C6BF|nr:hypothetical protein [Magnetofaba australis]
MAAGLIALMFALVPALATVDNNVNPLQEEKTAVQMIQQQQDVAAQNAEQPVEDETRS